MALEMFGSFRPLLPSNKGNRELLSYIVVSIQLVISVVSLTV